MQVSCAHPSVWPTRVTESLHSAHSQQADAPESSETDTLVPAHPFVLSNSHPRVYIPVTAPVPGVCARGIRSSGAGSQVGAGNWTQGLYKSNLLSLLSHLSSSYHQNIFSILEICLLNLFINEYFSLKFYWVYFNCLFKTLSIRSDTSFLEKYVTGLWTPDVV